MPRDKAHALGESRAYTEEQDTPVRDSLNFMLSPVMNQKRILAALTVGFGVVVLLLSIAGFITLRRSQSIQATAAFAVREHLAAARTIDRFQVQQERMSKLLWDVVDSKRGEPALARRIATLKREFEALTTAETQDQPALGQLHSAGVAFTTTAAKLLGAPPADRERLIIQLEKEHDQFATLATQVVKAQAESSAGLERQIQVQSVELGTESLWLLGTCLALSIAGAIITISLTVRSFRTMRWQSEELNRVSWHMLESQEAAARRFSHEMHDELGQSLTGLKALVRGMPGDDARRESCLRLLDEAIGNVRELSQLLRPVVLDDFGLDAGLRWLAERFEERTSIRVVYQSNLSRRLPELIETHLFRITQEALTNVARHSQATNTSIKLSETPSRVVLVIEDNGKGLPAQNGAGGPSLGIVGMRARARQIGGELGIQKGEHGGVRISAWVPLDEPQDAHADKENTNSVSR